MDPLPSSSTSAPFLAPRPTTVDPVLGPSRKPLHGLRHEHRRVPSSPQLSPTRRALLPTEDPFPPAAQLDVERPTPWVGTNSPRNSFIASPYGSEPGSVRESIFEKWTLVEDPRQWSVDVESKSPDDDDAYWYTDDEDRPVDSIRSLCSRRGLTNLGCLVLVVIALLALFLAYPIIRTIQNKSVV